MIQVGEINRENKYGPYEIIEINNKKDENNKLRQFAKIRFLNTGTERIVRTDYLNNNLKDNMYIVDFDKTYYSTYYGPVKVLEYAGKNDQGRIKVKIRFLNTGYETVVVFRDLEKGCVKDHTVSNKDKQICVPPFTDEYNRIIINILNQKWRGMMNRCYNPTAKEYQGYGSEGVKVCDLWHEFKGFLASITSVNNYAAFYYKPQYYQIDKDYLQLNIPLSERIYSPRTCTFLHKYDNSNMALMLKNTNNEFYGVKVLKPGRYKAHFIINGHDTSFGVYSNIIAAANIYNHYYIQYGMYEKIPLINHLNPDQIMSYDQAMSYLISEITPAGLE